MITKREKMEYRISEIFYGNKKINSLQMEHDDTIKRIFEEIEDNDQLDHTQLRFSYKELGTNEPRSFSFSWDELKAYGKPVRFPSRSYPAACCDWVLD